jgi:hypothetical protein
MNTKPSQIVIKTQVLWSVETLGLDYNSTGFYPWGSTFLAIVIPSLYINQSSKIFSEIYSMIFSEIH